MGKTISHKTQQCCRLYRISELGGSPPDSALSVMPVGGGTSAYRQAQRDFKLKESRDDVSTRHQFQSKYLVVARDIDYNVEALWPFRNWRRGSGVRGCERVPILILATSSWGLTISSCFITGEQVELNPEAEIHRPSVFTNPYNTVAKHLTHHCVLVLFMGRAEKGRVPLSSAVEEHHLKGLFGKYSFIKETMS